MTAAAPLRAALAYLLRPLQTGRTRPWITSSHAPGHSVDDIEQHSCSAGGQQTAESSLGEPPAAVATRTRPSGSTGRSWTGRPRYASAVIPPIECPARVSGPVTFRHGQHLGEVSSESVDPVGVHFCTGRTAVAAVIVGDDSNAVTPPTHQVADLECPARLSQTKTVQQDDRVVREHRQSRSPGPPAARRHS